MKYDVVYGNYDACDYLGVVISTTAGGSYVVYGIIKDYDGREVGWRLKAYRPIINESDRANFRHARCWSVRISSSKKATGAQIAKLRKEVPELRSFIGGSVKTCL